MVSRIPSVVFPWRPGAELQVGQGIPDLQPDAIREAPPLNARTGSPRPQRGCFRHQLLLPRPYLVLTKPLRLDIQCQRGASVKIGWKYLDD